VAVSVGCIPASILCLTADIWPPSYPPTAPPPVRLDKPGATLKSYFPEFSSDTNVVSLYVHIDPSAEQDPALAREIAPPDIPPFSFPMSPPRLLGTSRPSAALLSARKGTQDDGNIPPSKSPEVTDATDARRRRRLRPATAPAAVQITPQDMPKVHAFGSRSTARSDTSRSSARPSFKRWPGPSPLSAEPVTRASVEVSTRGAASVMPLPVRQAKLSFSSDYCPTDDSSQGSSPETRQLVHIARSSMSSEDSGIKTPTSVSGVLPTLAAYSLNKKPGVAVI
jgi:hypothetical protein